MHPGRDPRRRSDPSAAAVDGNCSGQRLSAVVAVLISSSVVSFFSGFSCWSAGSILPSLTAAAVVVDGRASVSLLAEFSGMVSFERMPGLRSSSSAPSLPSAHVDGDGDGGDGDDENGDGEDDDGDDDGEDHGDEGNTHPVVEDTDRSEVPPMGDAASGMYLSNVSKILAEQFHHHDDGDGDDESNDGHGIDPSLVESDRDGRDENSENSHAGNDDHRMDTDVGHRNDDILAPLEGDGGTMDRDGDGEEDEDDPSVLPQKDSLDILAAVVVSVEDDEKTLMGGSSDNGVGDDGDHWNRNGEQCSRDDHYYSHHRHQDSVFGPGNLDTKMNIRRSHSHGDDAAHDMEIDVDDHCEDDDTRNADDEKVDSSWPSVGRPGHAGMTAEIHRGMGLHSNGHDVANDWDEEWRTLQDSDPVLLLLLRDDSSFLTIDE